MTKLPAALTRQVGGDHYKLLKIQPVEYIHANQMNYFFATAVAYLTRSHLKGGMQDVKKAIHTLELYLDLETAGQAKQAKSSTKKATTK